VARLMADLLDSKKSPARVTCLDGSKSRLREAEKQVGQRTALELQFLECDLRAIPLADATADYIFCRFVFEYLPDPEAVFEELLRIAKPGGKIVIGDLDCNCLIHFPLADELQKNLEEMIAALHQSGVFDPYMGRKLYSYFHERRLKEIFVHSFTHHLFYGDLSPEDSFNWSEKLGRMRDLQEEGRIHFSFDAGRFQRDFLAFLKQPGRFSYTPYFLVEGVKPE